MKLPLHKLTESVIPVILLLSGIFFVLLFVEYRASQEAEKAHHIHITAQTSVQSVLENEMNTVVEVDFSDDPRIVQAQGLIAEQKFSEAEKIYFSILAQDSSAQIHNWLGTLYLKQEAYDKAVVSFSNALKLNSRYYRARYNRALAFSALDEDQRAISDYQAVIQDFDSHVKSHFNLGLLFYRQKEYTDAVDEFKRTAALGSGDIKVKALYLLGKSYTRLFPLQTEIAKASFNEAIRLKPNHIESRLALVDLEYPKNEEGYAKKLEALDVMLSLEPENIAIYRAVSKVYLALGKKSLALKSLQEALLYEPNNLELQFDVVELLIRLHKDDEAITALEKILTIEPTSTKAYFLLGRLYYLQGAFDASLSAYNKAQALKPEGSPELWNNLGLLYAKMERYDEAKEVYMKALSLRSAYPQVYYNLGLLAYKQKEFDRAQGYYEEAISLRPDYHQAYHNLALVFTKLGENDKAIAAYIKVLEVKPDSVRDKLSLAVRYSKVKEYNKARAIYEAILDKDSSYFTAWLNLGLVHYQQKEYQHSLEALEKAVELEPESEKAYRALAKSYSALKMHDEAISILQKLLEKNPSDVKTRLAFARSYYRAEKRNTALREYNKVLRLDPENSVAKKMIERIEIKKRKNNVSNQ